VRFSAILEGNKLNLTALDPLLFPRELRGRARHHGRRRRV